MAQVYKSSDGAATAKRRKQWASLAQIAHIIGHNKCRIQ
jgi:hypothetical protein